MFELRNMRSEQASRVAVTALRDPDQIVRATAAASVVYLPEAEAAAALLPLLSDREEFVRREAAFALGEVGSSTATSRLLQMARTEKEIETRTAAIIAIGKIGDPSAVAGLVSILSGRPTDENEFIRRAAARSIGQIAQILRTGKVRVVSPQNFLPEKFKDLISADSSGFNTQFPQFGQAVGPLTRVLENQNEADDTRREAAFSLGAIGDKSSIPVLTRYTSGSDPYLAEIAKEALLKFPASDLR